MKNNGHYKKPGENVQSSVTKRKSVGGFMADELAQLETLHCFLSFISFQVKL